MITLSSPPVSLSYVSSGLFVAHDEWIHADRVIDSWELIYMLNGAFICAGDARLPIES